MERSLLRGEIGNMVSAVTSLEGSEIGMNNPRTIRIHDPESKLKRGVQEGSFRIYQRSELWHPSIFRKFWDHAKRSAVLVNPFGHSAS